MENKVLVKKPVDRLKAILKQPTVQEQFKNALGKHSDRFVASLIDAFNGGLQKCEPGSVIEGALKGAVLGLPISKTLGIAYLVPYNQKYKEGGEWKSKTLANFQIGYKGLIQLAMRSGQVKTINAGPVYEGEFQKHDRLTGELDISGERKSDKVVGYFCYLGLINSFQKADYWTKEKVLNHAETKSKSYQTDLKYKSKKSTWVTDFEAMATKTVIIAVFGKYAPKSIEFITALEYTSEDEKAAKAKSVDLEVVELKRKDEVTQEDTKENKKTESEQINEFGPDF